MTIFKNLAYLRPMLYTFKAYTAICLIAPSMPLHFKRWTHSVCRSSNQILAENELRNAYYIATQRMHHSNYLYKKKNKKKSRENYNVNKYKLLTKRMAIQSCICISYTLYLQIGMKSFCELIWFVFNWYIHINEICIFKYCLILLVNCRYRRSPEFKFPIPFEDTLKAVKWFFRHASEYGIDASRIGIGGDSAGGALTALVSQHLHDDKTLPDNKLQVLIYPAVQKVNSWGPSYQKYERDFGYEGMLPRKQLARFLTYQLFGKVDEEFEKKYLENNHTSPEFKKSGKYQMITNVDVIPKKLRDPKYFSGPSNTDHGDVQTWNRIKDMVMDPRMSAMARTDFSGLPEAYVITCGFDSLRDDGILYGNVMKEAGVEVRWVHYEQAFHGIFWLGPSFNFELAERMRREAFDFIKEKLWNVHTQKYK